MSGEVLGGAAQGAAVGFTVAGPWGAAAGAVVGAIGGLFSSKANAAKRQASKEQRIMAEREAGIQRRDLVRQFRMARAQALASGSSQEGGLESSAVQGALGSIGSQGKANLSFFDTQVKSNRKINSLLNKASGYESTAGVIGSLVSLGSDLASSGVLGSYKGGKKSQAASSGNGTGLNTGFATINSFQSAFDRALSQGWASDVPVPILGSY